jgi:VanZ family protein
MRKKNMNHRRWGYLLLIASLFCIVIATVSPFGFVIPKHLSLQVILGKFRYTSDLKDYWRNILLFIPFGISLAWILPLNKLKYLRILIVVFLASAGLSFSVELIQVFLPIRVSNLTDIVTNTLGGVVGACLYSWRLAIVSFTAAIIKRNKNKLTVKSLLVAFVGYFSLIFTAIWVLLISVNFNNWSNNFHLVIGNEATGDRPWQGYITSLYISDRALDSESVVKAFGETHSFFSQLPNLVTSLVFVTENQFYKDASQQVSNLIWQGSSSPSNTSYLSENLPKKSVIDVKIHQDKEVLINRDRWLETQKSASYINSQLRKTSEFSLSFIVATNGIQQTGPARIISISADTFHRNLTLGQEGSDLALRLRTPVTGDNGSQPEFIIPNVFKDNNLHQILVTFAHQSLNFYIDRPENKYTFKFEPEISFLAYYPLGIKHWQINPANFNKLKYQIAFYGILLIPLGFLGGLLLSKFKGSFLQKILFMVSVCFLPALLIEQLYVTISYQPMRLFNLLFSFCILFTTTLVIKKFYFKRLFESRF